MQDMNKTEMSMKGISSKESLMEKANTILWKQVRRMREISKTTR